MMRKSGKQQTGLLFFIAVLHIAAAAVSGTVNIFYSLRFEAVTAAGAALSSLTAAAAYVTGAAAVCRARSAAVAGFGTAFWGVSLAGFVFYSLFNIFGIPITVYIPGMTALLRLLMVFFTLPLLAVNYFIALIPQPWAAFFCAMILPLSLFVLNLTVYIKIKKTAFAVKKQDEET